MGEKPLSEKSGVVGEGFAQPKKLPNFKDEPGDFGRGLSMLRVWKLWLLGLVGVVDAAALTVELVCIFSGSICVDVIFRATASDIVLLLRLEL